jgi:hypothetical protein
MESREAIPRRPSLATRKGVYEVLLTRSPSPFGRRLSLTGGRVLVHVVAWPDKKAARVQEELKAALP